MDPHKDSFLLHLISNNQPELYRNRANHFKTMLDKPLSFPSSEEWEVGVREFGYVNNIDTLTEDCTIRIGKIYETNLLNNYLPHYLYEGGSRIRRHYIYETMVRKSIPHPAIVFGNYIKRYASALLQLTASKPTIFYIGSDAVQQKPVFKLHFKPTSVYEEMIDESSKYVLVLSVALAGVFQFPQCVLESGKSMQSKVKFNTYLDLTDDMIDRRDYWFSIIPLHRTSPIERPLLSSRMGSISVLELFQQLQ